MPRSTSKKVIYDVGDGNKLVEFYCYPFEKDKSEFDKGLENINFAWVVKMKEKKRKVRLQDTGHKNQMNAVREV